MKKLKLKKINLCLISALFLLLMLAYTSCNKNTQVSPNNENKLALLSNKNLQIDTSEFMLDTLMLGPADKLTVIDTLVVDTSASSLYSDSLNTLNPLNEAIYSSRQLTKVKKFTHTYTRYVLTPGLNNMPKTGIRNVYIKLDPKLNAIYQGQIRSFLPILNIRRTVESGYAGHRWRLNFIITTANNYDIYVQNTPSNDIKYSGQAVLDGRNPNAIKRTIKLNPNSFWNNINDGPGIVSIERNEVLYRFFHLLFHTLGITHDENGLIKNNQTSYPDFVVQGKFSKKSITTTVKQFNVDEFNFKHLSVKAFTKSGGPNSVATCNIYEPTVYNWAILAGFYGTLGKKK